MEVVDTYCIYIYICIILYIYIWIITKLIDKSNTSQRSAFNDCVKNILFQQSRCSDQSSALMTFGQFG